VYKKFILFKKLWSQMYIQNTRFLLKANFVCSRKDLHEINFRQMTFLL